jgi:hypothetical protein
MMKNIARRAIIQTNGRYYRAAWMTVCLETEGYTDDYLGFIAVVVKYLVSFRISGTREVVELTAEHACIQERKFGRLFIELN